MVAPSRKEVDGSHHILAWVAGKMSNEGWLVGIAHRDKELRSIVEFEVSTGHPT